MNNQFDCASKGLVDLRRGIRATLLVILILAATVTHQRAIAAARANYSYLGILHSLSADLNWVEYVALERERFEPERSATPIPTQLKLLSSLHFDRHRDSLGRLFLALELVYYHEDETAITELLDLGASGVLWSIGMELNEGGDRQRSLRYLESAAELAPDSYHVLTHLAVVYLAENRWCDLLYVASRGVDRYGSGMFYYYLGRAYQGLEAWQQAVDAYERALERRPNYEPYQRLLRRSLEAALVASPVDPLDLCQGYR